MAAAAGGTAPVLGPLGARHLLLLLSLSLGVVPCTQGRELRLVTLLYRHGDRSPIKAFPTDVHAESAWPQGFGQLTPVGMRQHWELGQALRSRYSGFLNDSYDRTQIYVRSTDADRTLMSAEANLAGLYPPAEPQTFNLNISWQPIPVHTVADSADQLLKFPVLPCPRYLELQEETRRSAEFVNTTKENRSFMEMVSNETGVKDVSLESIWSIYDTLFCEHQHNMTLPSWATAEVLKRLEKLKNFSFQFLFGIHKPMEKAQLQGGLLLDQILKNFSQVTESTEKQHLKVIMYSAHDSTVVALQTALNVYNGVQPPYAACHIMELFQEDSGNFSVEMYYRNESGISPFPLVLPGCPQRCPLQQFLRLTQDAISRDREHECEIPDDKTNSEVIIGLVVCGVLLFLLIVLLLIVVFRLQSQPTGYNPVLSEGEERA